MTPALLTLLSGLARGQVPAPPWWDPAWTDRAQLRFDNAGREALVDFPVLVVLQEGENFAHSAAAPDGADLRFVDEDGTWLAHDLEEWNLDGRSYLWVRVPQIDADSTTDRIWMYFGGGQVPSGEREAETWPAVYTGVWHLDASLRDAAQPSQNAANNGTEDAEGIVGRGRRSDGDEDRLEVPDEEAFDYTGAFTVSTWVRVDAWAEPYWDAIFTKGDYSWRLHRCADEDTVAFSLTFPWGETHDICSEGEVTDGQWHHLAGVFDPVADYQALYLDGHEIREPEDRLPATTNSAVWIGNSDWFEDRSLDGWLDEVRAQTVARSADWIEAEYTNVTGAFVSWCDRWVNDLDGDGVCDQDDLCPGSNDGFDEDLDGAPDGCDPCPQQPDDDCLSEETPLDTAETGLDSGTAPADFEPSRPAEEPPVGPVGCGCAQSGPPPGAGLILLGLALLRRARRPSSLERPEGLDPR